MTTKYERNGIDPFGYIMPRALRNLTEFHQRVISDSTAYRAHHDFENANRENRKIKVVSLEELIATVEILKNAPSALLEFPESCAQALSQLMEWGWVLQQREKLQSFLGGIAPAPQDRKDWNWLLSTGFFK